VPVLVDVDGPLFGTENICRTLARRAGADHKVVLRGDVADRLVANVEEMTLHVMSTEVTLVVLKLSGEDVPAPPKLRRSLENALTYLDRCVDRVLAALPADRTVSFLEVGLFSTVTHLSWRQVMTVSGCPRLAAFCERFGQRESARQTEYRFDAPC
jgi:glutathione S-transferase